MGNSSGQHAPHSLGHPWEKSLKSHDWFEAKSAKMTPVTEAKRIAPFEYKRTPSERNLQTLRAARSKGLQTAWRGVNEYRTELNRRTRGTLRLSPSIRTRAIEATATYRGISFFSIVGKVFARVILIRLQQLAERVYPESKCSFGAERSTLDMVFSLSQLHEKCREHTKPLSFFTEFLKPLILFITFFRTPRRVDVSMEYSQKVGRTI